MKTKIALLTACLLITALLAGCAAEAPVLETQAMLEVTPETLAPAATAPIVTEAPTEGPTEAPEPYEITVTPVITGEQSQVTVATVDEFLAAIAPNTEIILDGPMFDLSTAKGYGKTNGDFYQWREEHDGPGLYIVGVSNLTIRGASDDHNATVMSADPRYAHVMTFENCSNIHLKGFTAGHSKEAGSCMGGVLGFINSQDVLIEDCGLFGCGTWGVFGESSKNIQVAYGEIYECSTCGLYLSGCDQVSTDGTTFRDLGEEEWGPGYVFRMYDCGTVTCNGKDVMPFLTIEEMEAEYGLS